MKCPNAKCGRKIQVSDSREKNNGYVVKRRRRCNHCNQTWTTCEVIQGEQNMITSLLPSQRNLTPNEVYNEIIRLLGLLSKSMGLVKNSVNLDSGR